MRLHTGICKLYDQCGYQSNDKHSHLAPSGTSWLRPTCLRIERILLLQGRWVNGFQLTLGTYTFTQPLTREKHA